MLNRLEKVGAESVRRVQSAIAELGFVRNDAARQLKAGSSNSIGFILLDVRNPFFTDVARGIELAAEQGLPEDVSDDARAGLELIAKEIGDLPDDVSAEELETAGEDFSDEDEVKSDAFDDYVEVSCSDAGSEPEPGDTESSP